MNDTLRDSLKAALLALGESESIQATNKKTPAENADFLQRAIQSAPYQFTGEELRAPAVVPFNALAQLIGEVLKMEQRDRYLSIIEPAHIEQTAQLINADRAFFNPREKDPHKANELAAKAIGLTSRKKNKAGQYLEEFSELRKDGVDITEAYKILAEKHSVTPDAIRHGIKRARTEKQ